MQKFFVGGRWITLDEMRKLKKKKQQESLLKSDDAVKNPENPLECPYCGKVCASKLGLSSHMRSCKKKAAK